MIAYKSKNLCRLLAVLVAISTSFADAHLRGVDDHANQQSSQSRGGTIEEIHSGHRAKARGKPRNKAHRYALQNIRAMDGIGHVSDDVRNRDLSVQSRIVGGTAAGSGEYKFFASWDIGCGGSLIAPNMILTAAHCGDQSNGSVRIGSNLYSSGGITRRVTQQCKHPKYDSSLDIFDFMLLTLDSPVDTTKFPVIKLNNDKSLPKTDAMLTVIGFGATTEGGSQSNTLLKVDVPANSHQLCLKQYNWVVEEAHLCAGFTAGGKDSCQGDSGGPIFEMINGVPVQVGVVSTGDGCARPNKSGVYARLSGGYDWIQQTMTKLNSGDLSGCGGIAPVPTPKPVTSPTPKPVTSPTPKPVLAPTPKPVTSPTPKPVLAPTPRPITPPPTPKPVTPPTPKPVTPPTPKPVIAATPKPVISPTPRPITPPPTPRPITPPPTPKPVTPPPTPKPVTPPTPKPVIAATPKPVISPTPRPITPPPTPRPITPPPTPKPVIPPTRKPIATTAPSTTGDDFFTDDGTMDDDFWFNR